MSLNTQVLPVVELLSSLSDGRQLISALSLLQSGCQSVDGCDVSIIHCHFLQVNILLSSGRCGECCIYYNYSC